MSLVLSIKTFGSRIARKAATDGKIRSFLPAAGAVKKKEKKGFFGTLWDGFAKFGVSLLKNVWNSLSGFLSWSATKVMGMIVAAKEFILNFNWNPSDQDLDNKIKNAFNALPGLTGNLLGKASGYLLCGALPGAVIFSFNEAMGARVFFELGEEALDEFTGEIANLIRATFTAVTQAAFAFAHKQIRTLWRESDADFKKRLEATGLKKEHVDRALADRNKPFIIRQELDKAVESIKSKPLKDFTQNFLEEFDSSCVEAGYVVAGGIDSYVAEQANTAEIVRGREQDIQVEIDENGDVKLSEYKENIKPSGK